MLQQPLTLLNDSQVITNTFGRRLPGSRLIQFASLLVNEGMNGAGTSVGLHDQFVILTTFFNVELVSGSIITTDFTVVAGLEVVHQGITEHQSPLTDIQLDGVAGVLLGGVVSEGGRHRFVLTEVIVGRPRRLCGGQYASSTSGT